MTHEEKIELEIRKILGISQDNTTIMKLVELVIEHENTSMVLNTNVTQHPQWGRKQ